MIDLHLHTVFSDGRITDIKQIVDNCNIISITDHNSIAACNYFSDKLENTKLIVGCEVTVDRAPDYLIFFPDKSYSDDLEEEFKKIRVAEENVIKECYRNLGYSNWDEDISRAYAENQQIKSARTRDLAAIIHLYKTSLQYDSGKFDFDDLKIARRQRWEYAEKVGNPISEDIAFQISRDYDGVIVLAHPIHTAIKKCSKDNTNANTVREKLVVLLDSFSTKGGVAVEWEYFSVEHLHKYNLSVEEIREMRNMILDKAGEYDFGFTMGSDSHSLDNYYEALKWLSENELIIRDKLLRWIKY